MYLYLLLFNLLYQMILKDFILLKCFICIYTNHKQSHLIDFKRFNQHC